MAEIEDIANQFGLFVSEGQWDYYGIYDYPGEADFHYYVEYFESEVGSQWNDFVTSEPSVDNRFLALFKA